MLFPTFVVCLIMMLQIKQRVKEILQYVIIIDSKNATLQFMKRYGIIIYGCIIKYISLL